MNVAGILGSKAERTIHRIAPAASVLAAIELMAARNIGALVVMDGDRMLGIITERDYARKVILEHRSSKDTAVREIMSSPVPSVGPGQTNEECMKLMTDKRVRHLPVVDGENLIGLVSMGDLVKDIISEQKQTIEHLEHYIRGERG